MHLFSKLILNETIFSLVFILYNKLRPHFDDLTWWFVSNEIRKKKLLSMIKNVEPQTEKDSSG